MEVLMRVLYVFDWDGDDRREAGSALAAWAEKRGHETVMAGAPDLKPCLGCFGCWIKTPGYCVVKGDEGAAFVRSLYEADLVVLGGDTPYGSFALPIKAALDRAIPLLLPYFRKFRGEMHHVPRYERLPRFLSAAFGEASEAEEATYLELVRSFCDNVSCPRQKRSFRYRGDAAALVAWLEEELAL
jgi:multimeric flavodoxin WrbA